MSRSMTSVVLPVLSLWAVCHGAEEKHNADWFHHAKWGVMIHYLGAPPSSRGGAELTAAMWNAQIDSFNVAGLVQQ